MSSIRAALKTILPGELVVSGVVADTADVYFGRRGQNVRKKAEAWLEELPSSAGAVGGLQQTTRHVYLLHVFRQGNDGRGQLGERSLDENEPKLHSARLRLQGQLTNGLKTAIPGLIHVEAVVEEVDEEPEAKTHIEGTVRLTFTVAE